MQAALQRIFGFMPDWLAGLGLIALAIPCALLVYRWARAVVRHAIGSQNSLALPILQRTAGPVQLAICLIAVALVLPFAPLDDELRGTLTHLFAVATIALVGWISIRAVDLVAGRYLQRFSSDIAENFLARKQATHGRVCKRVTDTIIVIVGISTARMTFDSVRQYGVSLFASAGAAGLILGL